MIWSKKHLLGEVIEDGITQLLNKKQLVDFYYSGTTKFKVPKWKIEKYILKNDE